MRPPISLLPEADVTWADGRWQAHSCSPWLAAPGLADRRGQWLRLRYHAGLFDEHVRPLLRFRSAAGDEATVPMNGALTGVGEWTGRVPDDTVAVSVCPVRSAGPFSFAIVAVQSRSRIWLVARGLWANPRLTFTAIGARVIGARAEARHCLAFAALATPLRHYAGWLARRKRPIELAGFDRPRTDWRDRSHFHLIVQAGDEPAALERTRASLQDQSYPHWRLASLGEAQAPGMVVLDPSSPPSTVGGADDLIAVIRAGDLFHPHALLHLVEHMAAHPAEAACYGDEDGQDHAGQAAAPRLKPDPDLVQREPLAEEHDVLFWRVRDTAGTFGTLGAAVPPAGRLGHVRRLILRRSVRVVPPAPARLAKELPPVTVVIPTRDRGGLLAACLAGLEHGTDASSQIVIVDNGSVEPHALAVLAEAASRPGVRVLHDPGPFNFSALCNAGAALATTRLLLFLNNDVTPMQPDWMRRLAALAVMGDVGAVGARLLYPDGRLQHGGVVVGMGGTALHLHHRTRATEGYLGQLARARSVGAVTGAVLMVERTKFEAVGGFDAESFPVLLNDVDLCLRLRERGWHTMYQPAATLIHAESASRGRSARPFTLYARERRAFVRRWAAVIRDDGAFHPALSLTSTEPALG